jgi:glycine cleavage system aminomethyltransferase T
MALLAAGRRTPLGDLYAEFSEGKPPSIDGTSHQATVLFERKGGRPIELRDLTRYGRFGVKGRGASDWLRSRDIELPERINILAPIASRGLDIVRLGAEDYLFLPQSVEQSASLTALRAEWEADTLQRKGFNAWREEVWAWFHICGTDVADLLAKTCPVDLNADRLPVRSVVQTRVAQMDCILVRTDRTNTHGFDLFFDVASANFMMRSLRELGIG